MDSAGQTFLKSSNPRGPLEILTETDFFLPSHKKPNLAVCGDFEANIMQTQKISRDRFLINHLFERMYFFSAPEKTHYMVSVAKC